MNHVSLVGRLGADPEVHTFDSGATVCNMSLATSKKWTKDGEKQEKTEWHRLKAFNKTGELASQYLSKGRQVAIEGEIQYSSYEKDGEKKYTTDIIVNKIHFLSGESASKEGGSNEGAKKEPAQNSAPDIDTNEEIPF